MTPRNAAIVCANPELFAPLVRWLYGWPRHDITCACSLCICDVCARHNIDPDRLVALNTTPDMLPEGGRDG